MNERVEYFWHETTNAFRFLVQHYDYQQLEGSVKNANAVKDVMISNRYVGSQVGIEVWWYTSDAAIGVVFVELLQPNSFPEKMSLSLRAHPGTARVIRLSDLVDTVGPGTSQDPHFLLKDRDLSLPWEDAEAIQNANLKIIQENMQGILQGLARATQIYALDLLKGDTNLFPAVMNYYMMAKEKRSR